MVFIGKLYGDAAWGILRKVTLDRTATTITNETKDSIATLSFSIRYHHKGKVLWLQIWPFGFYGCTSKSAMNPKTLVSICHDIL